MPHLQTFDFNIVTECAPRNIPRSTPDDIRRTFIEREYSVDYIFYDRCHV